MSIPIGGASSFFPGYPLGPAPERTSRGLVQEESSAPVRSTGIHESGVEALRGRAPQDADPRLWALLTRAERDFYFRNATFGALTYRPDSTSTTAESVGKRLGGRIDLVV